MDERSERLQRRFDLPVMVAMVPDRKRWVLDNPIAVGVTALTPPFLSVFAPVRMLRLLRVLRLVRLMPLMHRVFSLEGLRYAAILAAGTVLAGGAAFAAVEPPQTTSEGIYWAITTMTTVGYSDLSPTTTDGKVLAAVVMLVGIGFVALLTGAVAERFLAPEIEEEAGAGSSISSEAGTRHPEVYRDLTSWYVTLAPHPEHLQSSVGGGAPSPPP